MGLQDLIITPIYFFCLLMAAYLIRPLVTNKVTKRYFLPGLVIKFIGAIALGMIFQFYYGYGGDTFMYFNLGSRYIWEAFLTNPLLAFDLIFGGNELNGTNFQYASRIVSFGDPATYFVVRVAGFFDLFTFHTYTATALFFAVISFSGVWAMYTTFYRIYPQLHKALAICILFIPSVFFWGSGILKDSLTLGALGWLFYGVFQWIHFKNKNPLNILIILSSAYLLYVVKIYIILCFVPAIGVWFYYHYQKKVKGLIGKILIAPVLLSMAVGIGYVGAFQIGSESSRYSTDRLLITAQETAQWNYYVSVRQGGSGYTLGDFDFSPSGMLKKFVPAVLTSFYRPFIWESKNPVMMLSGLENLVILMLTIAILFSASRRKYFLSDPTIILCLTFSIFFAFAVGVTTYNFGALVRYKIPMMPFLLSALMIMYYHKKLKSPNLSDAQNSH